MSMRDVVALILGGGQGSRLYPLTRDRPKPLLPVGGGPILDYLVDRLEAAIQGAVVEPQWAVSTA